MNEAHPYTTVLEASHASVVPARHTRELPLGPSHPQLTLLFFAWARAQPTCPLDAEVLLEGGLRERRKALQREVEAPSSGVDLSRWDRRAGISGQTG
jgi:hypothetical protein